MAGAVPRNCSAAASRFLDLIARRLPQQLAAAQGRAHRPFGLKTRSHHRPARLVCRGHAQHPVVACFATRTGAAAPSGPCLAQRSKQKGIVPKYRDFLGGCGLSPVVRGCRKAGPAGLRWLPRSPPHLAAQASAPLRSTRFNPCRGPLNPNRPKEKTTECFLHQTPTKPQKPASGGCCHECTNIPDYNGLRRCGYE